MNRKLAINFLLAFLMVGQLTTAQDKSLTLRDVWASGGFIPESFSQVTHLNDGEHFTRLKGNRQTGNQFILRYRYDEAEPVDTLFHGRQAEGLKSRIQGYQFSKNERYILFKTRVQKIYRYSTRGVFYAFDRETGSLTPVHNGNHVMYATIAPDEEQVAFVYENNLYIQDLSSGTTQQVTNDGQKNKILNGRSDWVYEEELELVKAFEWSPDGERIAYYKFNQSDLKDYTLKKYVDSNYPKQYKYKYPKAGEPNSDISLHVYDLEDETKTTLTNGEESEYYPRIKWTNDPQTISYQVLNRPQNQLDLYFSDAQTGKSRKVLTKSSETYVEVNDHLTFLDNNRFLWTSEADGYRHIYIYNQNGEVVQQVTEGDWVVTGFSGYDEANEKVYYQSAEKSPLERHVYSIDIDGTNKKLLFEEEGTTSANFSETYDYYIINHSDANQPPKATIFNREGKVLRKPVQNNGLKERMKEHNFTEKTFFQVETEDGTSLNGWMMKPPEFKADKDYPVFMTCYGGPGIQSVKKSWGWQNYNYYQYLAQQGYIVVTIDNRGTGARGTKLKKMTYKNLGHYESKDQITAAKALAKRDYVDEDRIGIFGWSYGGYLTLLSLAKGADVFQTGVAVAPVTDWRFYDNIYTERYMRKPSENPEGYRKSSVLNHVDSFQDKFLLVHGAYDDNVHPQHSMEFMKKMISRNKPFDSEFYPNKTHSISGGWTRYHLFKRITDFLAENLKSQSNE